MKHLSALDAVFLHLETPETPMHVGSLMLLDKPPGRKKPYTAIRDHIARRMHLAPVFTRKLAFMPLDLANPVWLHADEVVAVHRDRGARERGKSRSTRRSTTPRSTGMPEVVKAAARGVTAQIPLAEAKAIARHFDAKLNDVVLATRSRS